MKQISKNIIIIRNLAVKTEVCASNNVTYVGTCASNCAGFSEDEVCEGM